MIFKDALKATFPSISKSEKEIEKAILKYKRLKKSNMKEINSSKYRKKIFFKIGDKVLVRNNKRSSKFYKLYCLEPNEIIAWIEA